MANVEGYRFVFCGVVVSDSSGTVSGGRRRFKELYDGFSASSPEEVVSLSTMVEAQRLAWSRKAVDAIVVVFDERYLLLALICRFGGGHVVFCPRGNKLEHYVWDVSWFRLRAYKALFGLAYRWCDGAVFQTEAQRREFFRMFAPTWGSRVVPNNSNASWMVWDEGGRESRESGTFRVGFVGNDSTRKGLDVLLRAFRGLREQLEKVELAVAGVSMDRQLGEGVRCLGRVDDLNAFFPTVDVVVVPSRYDSFPNVVLEAAGVGKALLVARSEMTEEMCSVAPGVLFELDPCVLQARLALLASSRDKVVQNQIWAREIANNYRFDWVAEMKVAIEEVSR